MTTIKDNKAHGEVGLNFVEYLADFDKPTDEQRKLDSRIIELDDLQNSLHYPTNHIDKLRYLHDDFSIRGGENIGLKAPNTQGGFILVMIDNDAEVVNGAAIMPNSDDTPIISDLTQTGAFVIGSMSRIGEWWLVTDLKEAIALYAALAVSDPNVTVLVCLNSGMFDKALRHFAEVKTINITDSLANESRLTSRLAGVNAIVHLTPLKLMNEMLNDGDLINDIVADAKRIDLQKLDWSQPELLATDPSKPTPYPINAWDGLLRQVIDAVAYYAQVPLAMAAQCVLGAIAHIGQQFVDAPHGHKRKPASLILITEGESGTGKTETMNLTHLKIDEFEKQRYEEYLNNYSTWEADKENLKGSELKAFLDNTPKPKNPKSVFDDATIEHILDKFVKGDMLNASWTTDEAAQFFNGHTMKGDTAGNALGAITKLYSGGHVSRSRSEKTAKGMPFTDAYDARMTLLLQGQRAILEPALSDPLMNGQGFLARALIACPEDLRGYRTWNDPQRRRDNPYDNPLLIEYWSRCESLLNPTPNNEPIDTTGKPRRIRMNWIDKQTEQVFYDRMQTIENRARQGGAFATVKAYASRMAENASRIASLIAFFDERTTITTDDIKRAFMLVEYSTAERLRYLDATPTGDQNDSEKLSHWLVDKAKSKNPHKLGRTYISNNAPNPMRKNTSLLQNELDKLEAAGHIKQEIEGRLKVIYVNPKLYD